jgi:hypothetical protein
MALLAVGTVLLVLQRRVVVSALTMAAAVLTKYVPVLLVPALLAYLWRRAEDKRSLLWRITGGAVAGAGVAVALYAPYWAGRQTFGGLGSSGRAGHTGSTQTCMVEILSLVISEQTALRVVSLAAAATVLLAAIAIAVWVRTAADLLRGIAVIMVIYTLLSPAYWPWYVVLPVAPLDSLYVDEVIGRPSSC